jgi:hypothetical protein
MTLHRTTLHSASIAIAAGLGLLTLIACGGHETVASKSAAAYREAAAKGTPIGHGEHGGHENSPAGTSSQSTAEPHAMHDGDATSTGAHVLTHDAMPGHDMSHGTMDHSSTNYTDTMDHSVMNHAAMNHAAGASDDHASHAGTGRVHAATGHDMSAADHAAMNHGQAPHAAHASTTATSAGHDHSAMKPASGTISPATSATPAPNGKVGAGGMLKPDAFDAPAVTSVDEASRAAGGHSTGHDSHDAGTAVETIYTCPMHPEVVSTQPGRCPKCGMTLVKKEK